VRKIKYLLVCDVDDTLTGDKKGIRKFNEIISPKKFCLAYSSGRFKASIISLIVRSGLVYPDVLISNLGTEIYYAPNWTKDQDWEQVVKKNWNKENIISVMDCFGLQHQPYDKKFVVPYYTDNDSVVKKVKKKIADCDAKVVHTGKRFLDIIPESAGKGNAARYVGDKMKLPIICCGDSENDEEMLKKSDYGILVGNSPVHLRKEMSKHPKIHVAESFHAMGVIEGLKHHSII
jgi:sucrose-6F-phosphate phosphohydrolase